MKATIGWRPALLLGVLLFMTETAQSQPTQAAPSSAAIPVTVDNFVRAESDMYVVALAKQGGVGKFLHRREPASIEHQTVIRLNRDTFYSSGVFDLDAGPVTITMPDPGRRYMALQVINEDHYVPSVFYGAGTHVLTKENVGTRYVVAAIRTLVDPSERRGHEAGACPARRDTGEPGGAGPHRGAELGPGRPEEGARRAARAGDDDPRLQEGIRHVSRGRSRCGG